MLSDSVSEYILILILFHVYYEKLDCVIMEAEKSYDLLSAS